MPTAKQQRLRGGDGRDATPAAAPAAAAPALEEDGGGGGPAVLHCNAETFAQALLSDDDVDILAFMHACRDYTARGL